MAEGLGATFENVEGGDVGRGRDGPALLLLSLSPLPDASTTGEAGAAAGGAAAAKSIVTPFLASISRLDVCSSSNKPLRTSSSIFATRLASSSCAGPVNRDLRLRAERKDVMTL